MEGKALAGIDPKTMVVEIVASLESHADDHLKEIADAGYLPVVTSLEIARKVWGARLESVFDLVSA